MVNEYLIREGKSFLGNEFITIMGIKLSPDLSVALIFVSVLNNEKSEFVKKKLLEKKYDKTVYGKVNRKKLENS